MKIKQDLVRVVLVDYDSNGKEEKIAIQNPSRKVKKKVFDFIKDHHETEDDEDKMYEVMEYMIDQLVDIELNVRLNEIDIEDCSFMFKCIVHEINMIFEELSHEYMMTLRMNLLLQKRKLEEGLLLKEIAEVAKLKEDGNDGI